MSDMSQAEKAEKVKREEEERDWPKEWGDYFFINDRGKSDCSQWRTLNHVDYSRKSFHNIFKTSDEAERERSYLQFERDVRAKAAELNDGWVADYSDKTQTKFWLMNGGYFVFIQESFKHSAPIVRGSECKSREAVQALNDQFGEDKFLAYAAGKDLPVYKSELH